METKASYVVVGAFSLLAVAAAFLFALWAAKSSQGDLRAYEVLFRQGVSGLSVGSAVTLEGVRVGQVSHIKVSPADPGQVIVRVLVAADAPVRQNSQATLEPQGVTGLGVVAISGGTAESPLLADIKGQVERIPAHPSKLQEIMNSVPSILASLDDIVRRANHLLSPEHTETLGNLLVSVARIAETLARNRDNLGKGLAGFGDAGQSFAVSGRRLEQLMISAQTLVDKDFRNAARSVDKASGRVDAAAAAIEPGLARFSRDSVEELHRTLAEARRFMASLSSLVQKMESDPRRFLLGNPVPEFSAP